MIEEYNNSSTDITKKERKTLNTSTTYSIGLKENYKLIVNNEKLVYEFQSATTAFVKIVISMNNFNMKLFKKVDKAFFDIFGEEFFGYVDSEYMYPPYIDIAIRSGNGSYGFGLTKTNYKWHKKEVNNINNIDNIVENMLEEIPAITNLEIKHALKYMDFKLEFLK